jgi:hypothetical protein
MVDLPGVITPADIAHGVIEIRKPPYHDKVQSREEANQPGFRLLPKSHQPSQMKLVYLYGTADELLVPCSTVDLHQHHIH